MELNQDTYRKWILPALGVAETIATRGRSPGTTALSQEQIFRDAEESALKKKQIEAQIADQQSIAQQRALEGQLTPYAIADARRKQKDATDEDAAVQALQAQLGGDATLSDTDKAYYKYNPKAYGERLKPEPTQIVLGNDGQYHSLGKKDAKDTNTHTAVTAPPKPVGGMNPLAQTRVEQQAERIFNQHEKTYEVQAGAFQNLIGASRDKTGASDQALIDEFVRLQKGSGAPNESQYKQALGTVGVGGLAEKFWNKLGGSLLTQQQRDNIVHAGREQMTNIHGRHMAYKNEYGTKLKAQGLDPSHILTSSDYETSIGNMLSDSGKVSDDDILNEVFNVKPR